MNNAHGLTEVNTPWCREAGHEVQHRVDVGCMGGGVVEEVGE
jgi:hypothetical protein